MEINFSSSHSLDQREKERERERNMLRARQINGRKLNFEKLNVSLLDRYPDIIGKR